MCILHPCGFTTWRTVVHRAAVATNRYNLLQLLTPQTSGPTLESLPQNPCYKRYHKYSSIFSTWNKSLILVSSPRKTIPRLRSKYLILRSIVASSCDRAILPNLTRSVSRVTSSRSDCQYAKGSSILY